VDTEICGARIVICFKMPEWTYASSSPLTPPRRILRLPKLVQSYRGLSLNVLDACALKPDAAEVTMKALNEVALAGADAEKTRGLLEALDELDDVQNVYTTAVFDE